MKIKITWLTLLVLLTFRFANAQKQQEFYFSFPLHSRDAFHSITRQISIDNIRNDTVWAYANIDQFLKFSKMGYNITLLPSPGYAPDVVMSDNGILSPSTTWNYYPTYPAYESLMAGFQANYPNLCQVTTIATLASGRKLLVAKISDNVATDEAEPEVLFTSSIHGDETTGYVLMLHLMDYLLTNYGSNSEVTDLVNSMEIYINPLANPDGTYHGGNNSVSGATRGNANGVDMNRNYPDPQDGQHPDGNAWQPETVAFMDFASQHHFVEAVNFHGGAEVVNYPWDTWATLHADDNWWQYISKEYVDTVRIHSPASYMTSVTASGYTNGFAWYEVNGGRQDYMNYWQHCREFTIELSNVKLVNATLLPTYWDYNYRSFLLYLKQARYGINGIITDQITGLPVAAKVYIPGHDNNNSEVYSTSDPGDYYRPIKAGTYTLEVSATCYQTQTISNVVVTDHGTVNLNIQLVPTAGVSTAAASAITMITATSGGTVLCDGGSTITARGVCWATTANPTILNSLTSDGSGTGTYTSSLTGLSASTIYHIRAYASNAGGTVYGDDLTFTTSCGIVSAFPWTEEFENAGSGPGCWTQEQVAGSGINWIFITGSGNSHPSAAHGGTYNACLKDLTAADNKTRLVSPSINLNGISSPTLTFWHTQAVWSGDQDQLIVYYRTSSTGTWTMLATYTASITAWTMETISLPAGSSDYYIAFEGNAKYGYGVCLDDVSITGTPALPTVTTAAATSVTTTTASSGGTVTDTGGASVTARGVCWSTTASPVITGNHTTDGSGIGVFTSSITGLSPNTAYHVRAYATNSGGTAYGSDIQFTTAPLPTLSITPTNQSVTALAGITSFVVTSNSPWTSLSDQAWCVVTTSGSGNGTVTATYETNLTDLSRIAHITVSVTGLTPVVVSLTQEAAVNKTLNLTIFLEGLFNGTSMNKAQDVAGDKFTGTIADQVTVELHNSTPPYGIAGGPYSVNLNTDGTAALTLPLSMSAYFFIVIRHRNSIETWNNAPISFIGSVINYDFTNSASKAYGNNLKLVSGKYVIFAGDVNQDGIVDSIDMETVAADAAIFKKGYFPDDVNGDGLIDSGDLIMLDNNLSNTVGVIRP